MDEETTLAGLLGEFMQEGDIDRSFDVDKVQHKLLIGSTGQNFVTIDAVERKAYESIEKAKSEREERIREIRTIKKLELAKAHEEAVKKILAIIDEFRTVRAKTVSNYVDVSKYVDSEIHEKTRKFKKTLDECARVRVEMELSEMYDKEHWEQPHIETFCDLFRTKREAYEHWNFDPITGRWSFLPNGRQHKLTIHGGTRFALLICIKPVIQHYHNIRMLDNAILECCQYANNLKSLILLVKLGYIMNKSHEDAILNRIREAKKGTMTQQVDALKFPLELRDFYLRTVLDQIHLFIEDTDIANLILSMVTGKDIRKKII